MGIKDAFIEVLEARLRDVTGQAAALVGRYVEPRKGDTYCSRNEVLLAREHLKTLLK